MNLHVKSVNYISYIGYFEKHQESFTGNTKHKCLICCNSFAAKSSLDGHLHVCLLLIVCSVCAQYFKTRAEYNKYVVQYHDGQ